MQIKDHVLLPLAGELDKADAALRLLLKPEKIKAIVDAIPDTWLYDKESNETPDERREVYFNFIINRIAHSAFFVNEANHARKSLI